MRTPKHDRTRYRKPPIRRYIEGDDQDIPEDDEPPEPINGPGQEEGE
jgi:hypothetical protein